MYKESLMTPGGYHTQYILCKELEKKYFGVRHSTFSENTFTFYI